MLLLIISYISSMLYSICAQCIITLLKKKSIGMQTLWDKATILALRYHALLAWNYVTVFTLAAVSSSHDPTFALAVSFILVLNVVNNALIMVDLALVRYISVAWLNLIEVGFFLAQK